MINKKEPITFSPNLFAEDAYANYWMRQVTIRLRREICWCWYERGTLPDASSSTLPPFVEKVPAILDMSRYWEEKIKFYHTDPTARYLSAQLEIEPPTLDEYAKRGSFSWVVERLNLDDVSSFVLALGLSVSFDNAMGSVIASCQNDSSRIHPNLSLAQKLWDYPEQVMIMSDPAHPLFRYGLLQISIQNQQYCVDWETPIIVPPLVTNQLLFPNSHLPHSLTLIENLGENDQGLSENASIVTSRLISKSRSPKSEIRIIAIRGSRGSSYIETVKGIAAYTNKDVVEFTGDYDLLESTNYLNSILTLCWLRDLALFLKREYVSSLFSKKTNSDIRIFPLQSIPISIFLSITDRSQLANIPSNLLLPIVDVPSFSYQERVEYWKKTLGEGGNGLESVILECSRRFRYEKDAINSICEGIHSLSGPVLEKDLTQACRAELELDMGELAQKVIPRFWDEELILPHYQYLQFEEIIKAMKSITEVHYGWGTGRVWNESGISVLFAGPPGTGKTMAAEILAIMLDLPMYRIDLSQVVNKYIGETEKNLKRLFDTADVSDTILFFDEADSLFGRRTEVKDAHDRYANLEISYLLERMERFKGLAILATNRKKDLDEAFLRRLRYILDFPLPGVEQRKKIWRQVIPKTVDSSRLDIDFLAKQFTLAGGHIRSIIFNACLQSANGSCREHLEGHQYSGQLNMDQVIIAVKREFDKLNRSISLEQFGPYARIIERIEHE
ncbi:MAG: ATP-binding protein [Thermodesulfobacteriota bacterium]